MIKYPKGSSNSPQTAKHINKSNLGQSLEDDLNQTNNYYRETGQALIYKKPTPVQVVAVDFPKRSAAKITEAYYKLPSTTDYNGLCQGMAIDFEAKQTANKSRFPLSMIYDHQIEHLREVEKHGGLAFLIIRFTVYDQTYFVPFNNFYQEIKSTTRRSVPYSWFEKHASLILRTYLAPCHYLPDMIELINERKESSYE